LGELTSTFKKLRCKGDSGSLLGGQRSVKPTIAKSVVRKRETPREKRGRSFFVGKERGSYPTGARRHQVKCETQLRIRDKITGKWGARTKPSARISAEEGK